MSPIRLRPSHLATVAGTSACVLAIGAGGALLAAIPAATAATASRTVTLANCLGRPLTHPSAYVLACGDGDTALIHLRWRDWGAARATATGTDEVNLCEPDCAAGRVARVRVTVDAERVRHGRYTRIVVHAGRHRPKGLPAVETWTPVSPR